MEDAQKIRTDCKQTLLPVNGSVDMQETIALNESKKLASQRKSDANATQNRSNMFVLRMLRIYRKE
jgi:hypothetical protein